MQKPCWKNEKLGHGDTRDRTTSKKVETLDSTVIFDVTCGCFSSVAFTPSGLVYFCGYGLDTRDGSLIWRINNCINGNSVISACLRLCVRWLLREAGKVCQYVGFGLGHVAVVTEDGKFYRLGIGSYEQLEHGDKGNARLATLVKDLENSI